MSEFKCEVIKIDNVEDCPNADRLSVVTIRGYQCISAKLEDGTPRYKAGDYVVYIPEASIIPEWMLKKMGFWDKDNNCGMLSGSGRNRVKAIKLRGVVSQGILYPIIKEVTAADDKVWVNLELEPTFVERQGNYIFSSEIVLVGSDVSAKLGITKYEPRVPQAFAGVQGALFGFTEKYDIENLQNEPNVFTDGDEVIFTEKLHGTCFQAGFVFGEQLTDTQKESCFKITDNVYAFVTSKGLGAKGFVQKNSEENQDNIYVKIFKEYFLDTGVAEKIIELVGDDYRKIIFFGEVYGAGVQDLSYGEDKPKLKIFDILQESEDGTDKAFLDNDTMVAACMEFNLPTVPVLYTGPYSLDIAKQHRDGKTVVGKAAHIREGIVIRPVGSWNKRRGLPCDGRVQLKFVSPVYLLRGGEATEYQ